MVLWGGFTTNFIWCVILNLRNRSGHEYLNLRRTAVAEVCEAEALLLSTATERTAAIPEASSSSANAHGTPTARVVPLGPAPLGRNYLFSAVAGVTWCLQFFFYSMGQTKMGEFEFSSWTLHMASILIFSTLWGILLHEWKGTSKRTHLLIGIGLAILIASTMIVGCGKYLGASSPAR